MRVKLLLSTVSTILLLLASNGVCQVPIASNVIAAVNAILSSSAVGVSTTLTTAVPSAMTVPSVMVAISARAGQIWAADKNQIIYLYTVSTGTWATLTGSATSLCGTIDGFAWALSTGTNNIYRYQEFTWRVASGTYKQISCFAYNFAVATTASGAISLWSVDSWRSLPGTATWVSLDAYGGIWMIDASGNANRWGKTTWERQGVMPTPAATIDAYAANRAVVVTTKNKVYVFDGTKWNLINFSAASAASISVDTLYLIDMNGNVYQMPC